MQKEEYIKKLFEATSSADHVYSGIQDDKQLKAGAQAMLGSKYGKITGQTLYEKY